MLLLVAVPDELNQVRLSKQILGSTGPSVCLAPTPGAAVDDPAGILAPVARKVARKTAVLGARGDPSGMLLWCCC